MRNPNHQLIDGLSVYPIFHYLEGFKFQASFWWCRISQPSTVCAFFLPFDFRWLAPSMVLEKRAAASPGNSICHLATRFQCTQHSVRQCSRFSRCTGKLIDITMEDHHFEWENSLFLWSFSIAMFKDPLNYQRVDLFNFPVQSLGIPWNSLESMLSAGSAFHVPSMSGIFRTDAGRIWCWEGVG